jgi:hypothetical protein
MEWTEPIVTWGEGGLIVPSYDDFDRIERNIQYLKELLR